MEKKIITVAAFMGAVAIVLGAFGAHGLKAVLSEADLAVFETGVKYQMYHALFLLFAGTTTLIAETSKKIILRLIIIGVILFSGSLYLLSTALITSINVKFIGPITPVGGLLIILAWIVLFAKILGKKEE